MNEEGRRALDRAVRALAHRDHSAHSLRVKLDRAGFRGEVGDEAVAELVRAGYVSDERFAHARSVHLADRGYGDEWIRGDLDAQGISGALAEAALAALPPERERAVAHAARLGNGERAARTLQRRGFSEDSLEAVLRGGIADDP